MIHFEQIYNKDTVIFILHVDIEDSNITHTRRKTLVKSTFDEYCTLFTSVQEAIRDIYRNLLSEMICDTINLEEQDLLRSKVLKYLAYY